MFFAQLKNELSKLFSKKRTYIGFMMFVLAQFLIGVITRYKGEGRILREMERTGFEPEFYLSMLTFATSMVGALAFLLIPIFTSLVGGDLVSKEAEDGTLRMILSRPISRIRLLIIKWLAGVAFSFSIVFALGLFALAFSAIWFPVKGGMFFFVPDRVLCAYGFSQGLQHYLLAHLFMVPTACTIMSLAFMFSCFNMKPAAATILALSLAIIDRVMMAFPYFQDIQHWFISYYTDAWLFAFNSPVPWWRIWEACFILGAANVTFFVIGATVFQMRDIKS
jgi:ABC-2 type transport system permease protein